MFFEGSEKKFEIVVRGGGLLRLARGEWDKIVAAANAKIISHIYTEQLHAYLLSESSLFVWDDRITLITCGRTTLVESVLSFAKKYPPESWDLFIFERKNEYRPQLQRTSFHEDIVALKRIIPGTAMRLGEVDAHHLFLYHSHKPYEPHSDDRTLEILMYDLQGSAKQNFGSPPSDKMQLRKLTGVHEIFNGFAIDDFTFQPRGYSLNALETDFYYTVHVTPEENGSYVSFETNFVGPKNTPEIVSRVIKVFQPRTFDVIGFNCGPLAALDGYTARSRVEERLDCGYAVRFEHFEAPMSGVRRAYLLEENE